jgi:FtsP/CotA-like multicopper oxidase with cupredoxin domain
MQVSALAGQGVVEEWTIINLTPDAHPIHIHEVMFEVSLESAVYAWLLQPTPGNVAE